MTTSIHLPRPLVNRLLHQAQVDPNREVCGLIGARDGVPTGCYPIRNVAEQPECRYRLDPAQQIEAMRTMRERGESLFAIFHSHPTAPAEPSATDIAESSHPGVLQLIVSLNTKGVLELRAFRMGGDGTVSEIPVLLEPD